MLARLKPLVRCLKKIWAGGAYGGKELAKWCEEQGGCELEIVEGDKEAKGASRSCRSGGGGADFRVAR